MSKLYYNNLRYKGIIPSIKTCGATLDAAVYKGIAIGEEASATPEPVINKVDWVYSNSQHMNIPVYTNKDLKIHLVFKFIRNNGDAIVGYYDSTQINCYRIFAYSNWLMFDDGANRIGFYYSDNLSYEVFNTLTVGNEYDYTFGNFYYEDNDTSTVYGSKSVQIDPSNIVEGYQMYLDYGFAFKRVQIWDGSNNLLIDYEACLDENNNAGFYDHVSHTYNTSEYWEYMNGGGEPSGQQYECPECGGTGEIQEWYTCQECDGTGEYINPETGESEGPCGFCDGQGYIVTGTHVCTTCGGTGYVYWDPNEG